MVDRPTQLQETAREVVVTGLSLRSSLGDRDRTWKQLLLGRSGVRLQQPFPELPPRPLGMLDEAPADFARLTQTVVRDALSDAGLSAPQPDCGVVLGSSRAQQGQLERLAQRQKLGTLSDRPLDWLNALPDAGARIAAATVGSRGIVLAPMAACATGIAAIARAVQLLHSGACDRVLAGAVETPVTPLTLASFGRMGALAKTGCYPFDRQREGLALAEGAAVFVLETSDVARSRNAQPYGRLLDFGLTADGYHISAPAPDSGGAVAAVRHCLNRARLAPQDIHYIHAHGTSTVLNDAREAALLDRLFPHRVPISSTKGATGHTIGASGALGVAFCLLALRDRLLPPTVGLQHPEFDLDFVRETRMQACDRALCLSFGFGGQNAALVVAR